MSFGIYKQGQGYWTRVMTAVGAGVLGLAGANWAFQQLSVVKTSFQVEYLQAGAAAAVALLSALAIYYLVGVKHKTVDFLVATEGEMQKVNWSSKREVLGSTWVVIGVSVIISVVLGVTDLLFSWFFILIRVLEVS